MINTVNNNMFGYHPMATFQSEQFKRNYSLKIKIEKKKNKAKLN